MTTALRNAPTSFDELAPLFFKRNQVIKIANNTTAERLDDGDIEIRLHGHAIVQLRWDGAVRVRHCGYVTTTTFDRLKRFTPASWTVSRRGGNPVATWTNGFQPPARESITEPIEAERWTGWLLP